MADHVRTLRKRLERMERAQAQNTGRPVNQRDKALAEALRAGIAALEKGGGGAPRATGTEPFIQRVYDADPLAVRVPLSSITPLLSTLKPIDRDEHFDRDYIPFGAGWEVHTKGRGSSFRLAWADPNDPTKYDRWLVSDEHLHKVLTQMAYQVRAAFIRNEKPPQVQP